MTIFDRMERRFGWLAFPGFLRYYALFHVLVFVLQLLRPDVGEVFEFDRNKILAGEFWRVATMFFAHSEFGSPRSFTALIFLIFAVNFVFMVSDGLEEAWGAFKATLFYVFGIVVVLVANFIYPVAVPGSGTVLYAAAFLAFATLFPKVEILLFFILPVQVRFLGMLAGLFIVLQVVAAPYLLPFYLVALANYFIWAAIPVWRGKAVIGVAASLKKISNAGPVEAFHACVICKTTDIADPQLEFRIGHDGEEYCIDHLPPNS